MTNSHILGGTQASRRIVNEDGDRLGPNDCSDRGIDVQGERTMSTALDNPDERGAVVADWTATPMSVVRTSARPPTAKRRAMAPTSRWTEPSKTSVPTTTRRSPGSRSKLAGTYRLTKTTPNARADCWACAGQGTQAGQTQGYVRAS